MDAPNIQQRLSQISTAWTLIARAHCGDVAPEAAAQAALVERYQTAVYRYLLAAVRDLDVADELFQEFALRMVRGDFGRADPQRGRFRDYVKSSLINLVIDFRRKQKKQLVVAPLEEPVAPAPEGFDSDEAFLSNWRTILLDRAWDALAAIQTSGGPPFLTVLRFRSDHPELSSMQMVEQLNAQLQPVPPFTDAGLRKILQRARDKFTDLLVDEVARSLQCEANDAIEQELIDLGFQAYCKRALQRRQAQP
jgi:RNA polymerase sigma-70 factor (ECF subfamily)